MALLFICACTQPVADSVALSGQQVQRGLVGYDEERYVYPINVPGSNRTVEIVTVEPLDYPPDYDDYLAWKAQGKPASLPKDPQSTHSP